MDPLYYQPGEHAERLRTAQKSGHAVPLTELLTPVTEIIKRTSGMELGVKYIEVGDTDKQSGKILQYKTYQVNELPSRAKYIIHENNLLIPNHRNSINRHFQYLS